uniref:Uncharacterized protein n=1 Tax=Solanum tuberosum TaxID=4113 RepID=M1CNL5_SOLTU
MEAVYGATIYNIWIAMNKKNFQGQNVNTNHVMQQVQNVIRKRVRYGYCCCTLLVLLYGAMEV